MPDNDRYGDWLQEFRREVDEDLAARSPAPAPAPSAGSPPAPEALEAMQNAVDRFEDWWRNESSELGAEPDPGGEAEQVNKELDLSRREVLALREELGRLRTGTDVPVRQGAEEARRQQAEERARLLQRAAELEADNEALRRRELEALERSAETKVEWERARDAYDERVARLEGMLGHLEEKAKGLSEDRAFLQAEFSRQAARLEAAEADARQSLRRGDSLAEANRALEARLESEKARASELERRAAGLAGEADALRVQGAALQDRLVRAAAPDPEAAVRAGLDDLKAREAALTASFDERQRRLEERLREATLWLDAKVRETGGRP